MSEFYTLSLDLHRHTSGKWEIKSKFPLETQKDLSVAYTPGVAAVSKKIAGERNEAWQLTMKGNTVAVVSDGSAVLGLGDIGPYAALPVMEGKAILLKTFAGVDGVPIVLDAKEPEDIIRIVKAIAPTFGGINLEDIKAPKCFEIEDALQDIGIPVFHDDQHGTAIVLMAGLINSLKLTGKNLSEMTIVINGAGAAGAAVAKLLLGIGIHNFPIDRPKDIIMLDTKGVISPDRQDLHPYKRELLKHTNRSGIKGGLKEALTGADVFIGLSAGGILNREDIAHMAKDPIIFALANPVPEIMPEEAYLGGASVVGTGRSDFPNQVNNALAFPGVFRGALDAKASTITPGMKLAAAFALSSLVPSPMPERILPRPLEEGVAEIVAKAVYQAAFDDGVAGKALLF